jgi:hypothetical protein
MHLFENEIKKRPQPWERLDKQANFLEFSEILMTN